MSTLNANANAFPPYPASSLYDSITKLNRVIDGYSGINDSLKQITKDIPQKCTNPGEIRNVTATINQLQTSAERHKNAINDEIQKINKALAGSIAPGASGGSRHKTKRVRHNKRRHHLTRHRKHNKRH